MKMLATVLLVSAMSVAAAVAQPGRGDGEGNRGDKMKQRPNREQMAEKLDLTPEQQKALKDLRQSLQGQMIDLRANVQKAKLEVQNQLAKETVDHNALMSAVEAEAAAELAIKKTMIEHHLKVRGIVGPEKAEQLRDVMQERRGGGLRGPSGPGQGQGPGRDDDGGW